MSRDCGEPRRVGGVESCLKAMLDKVGFQEAIHPAPGVGPQDAAEYQAHLPQREAAERPGRETGVLCHPGEGPSPISLIEQSPVAVKPPGLESSPQRDPGVVDDHLGEDVVPSGRLEGHQAAEAVAEHCLRARGGRDGDEVGAFVVDGVVRSLRTASWPGAPLHDVDLVVVR